MSAWRNVPEPCEGVSPARWQQVKDLLAQTLEVSPPERPAFLERICAGDSALRSEIESLLEAGDMAGRGFLESPAMVDLGGISAAPRRKLDRSPDRSLSDHAADRRGRDG